MCNENNTFQTEFRAKTQILRDFLKPTMYHIYFKRLQGPAIIRSQVLGDQIMSENLKHRGQKFLSGVEA